MTVYQDQGSAACVGMSQAQILAWEHVIGSTVSAKVDIQLSWRMNHLFIRTIVLRPIGEPSVQVDIGYLLHRLKLNVDQCKTHVF